MIILFFLHCSALGIIGGFAIAGIIELYDLRGLRKNLVLFGGPIFIGFTALSLNSFYLGA